MLHFDLSRCRFVFNAIWAVVHLWNYPKEERHPLRVAPQFVAGIFLAYAWATGGLACALLTHFGYNAILFAMDKTQDSSGYDIAAAVYAAFLAVCGLKLLGGELSGAALWLHGQPGVTIPEWGVRHYVGLILLIEGALIALLELLAYDRPVDVDLTKAQRPGLPVLMISATIVRIFGAIAIVGVHLLVAWLGVSGPTTMGTFPNPSATL